MKADLDFSVSYRLSGRGGSNSNITYMVTVLAIIIAVLIGGTAVFFIVLNINDSRYIADIKLELADYEAKRIAVQDKQNKLNEITKTVNKIKEVNSVINGHRMLSKSEMELIYRSMDKGVEVLSVKYDNSMLVLECETMSVYAPSNSAENLNDAGISTRVLYSGFGYNDGSELGEDGDEIIVQYNPNEPKVYTFSLGCSIGAAEGTVEEAPEEAPEDTTEGAVEGGEAVE